MPAELSGGMKKRVALARALALEPKIILYDEPTTGLDPANVRRISALIAKTRQAFGVTSIMVTHDLQAIETITDRVAMLDRGRIIAVGTWKEMEASRTRACASSSRAKSRRERFYFKGDLHHDDSTGTTELLLTTVRRTAIFCVRTSCSSCRGGEVRRMKVSF